MNNNFMKIMRYIDNSISSGKNVLVHCVMGSQRSATIIALYLMTKYGMGYGDAIGYIKSKRPICFFGKVNYLESLLYVDKIYFNN
jgi:protein-tyrosine phosphatase